MIPMQRSDGGGVFDILDRMNGQMLCGCSTVAACQVLTFEHETVSLLILIGLETCSLLCFFPQPGAPFGSCKNLAVSNTNVGTNSSADSSVGFTGSVQFEKSASAIPSHTRLISPFPFLLLAAWLTS